MIFISILAGFKISSASPTKCKLYPLLSLSRRRKVLHLGLKCTTKNGKWTEKKKRIKKRNKRKKKKHNVVIKGDYLGGVDEGKKKRVV